MPELRLNLPRAVKRLLFSLSVALAAEGCGKKAPPAPPPPEVQIVVAQPTNVPIFEDWIGSLTGFVNAGIRAQVTGYLQTQVYKEGSRVTTNDVLFQIDPRPFQAALDAAKARLAQDQAQLDKTKLDVERYTPLAKEQAISQETLVDSQQANLAAVAQVKADEAAVESAELNLGFTKITSPVDGLAGIALAQVGDLLSPSSGLLTTVSTLDPIKVYFNVSEQSYLTFWKKYVNGDSTNEPALALQLILSDGTLYPEKGKFYLADRQVNDNTGTLQIAGLFPNPNYLLRPGQYSLVRAQTQLKTNALVVPQRAVNELQGSYQVVTVTNNGGTNLAHIQPVKIGPRVGPGWIIEEGLHPGDQVIVEGSQKAKEGALVKPVPYQPNPPATNNSSPAPAGKQ